MSEGGGENPPSLYQILFDLQIQISERFNLSPFQLRRERFCEFCLLVDRLHDKAERESKKDGAVNNGKIRVKAGDDWF